MRHLARAAVVALTMATLAAPAIAEAQSRRDRDDRREWRQDRRDDRRDYRRDRREDRRDWRSDRRDDRRDWREDRRDDRRDYRNHRRADRWDRNNRDWWRGRSDFRDFRGHRRGYWYAPGYGYHRVEPRYYGYRWQRGSRLPSSYHRYYVRDPYYYGLRPAPRGYRWVHADNDILLVALATGVIADLVLDIW
ncbi:RcnB family protein [Brevundimonas halotolerans]|uniref:Ni/Co efflux regulator RcnB n=1 Tax=Brevundimonas halotolerans TaxID=69670 RepID=A0A7W9E732_9CAUL|nr:RcnB family protein [Brevundimonas halotolerans]MBB5659604.1 Ni/Co efflux regulator RcnB [Brevundimonas halotolerans]